MDYYKPVRDQYIQKEMYPKEYRKDFFPKAGLPDIEPKKIIINLQGSKTGATNESLKLGPKPPCVPRFVSKIEGAAVEESARVFFEGIVDSQPQPVFTWYFDDQEIFPGETGWEDLEIHHSRKMSTLIITYAREHHMGKYTLIAQNKLGHDVSNCDLIVRKKQFPPVFWKRLTHVNTTSGSRLVAEVEVGGWPLPEIVWYKDDEVVRTRIHTENYNGFPNKYVPERRVEVKQIDEIRYCIIFHRISESDSGVYTCRAVNPLGEALCEAEFVVEAGEGGSEELYLPEGWRDRKRLTWKDEDARLKPFVGYQEPGLTDEDIANMHKGAATTPLPRAMEYLASLPAYKPTPMSAYGLVPMGFTPESGLKNVKTNAGKKGGTASKPSKFVAGQITHRGYLFDDFGRILPIWRNPLDPFAIDPESLHYRPVLPDYPVASKRPDRAKSPDGPHVWESHETVDALHEMLSRSGFRLDLDSIRNDRLRNANQVRRQAGSDHHAHMKEHAQARKNLIQKAKPALSAAAKEWEQRLNADAAGAQMNADDFTKQFMEQMYTESSSSSFAETSSSLAPPPALPPKTKIMFSPSRHVFSPTRDEQRVDSPAKEDFIPVKEKAKMIAQQQQEIELREMERREEDISTQVEGKITGENLKGGVRILPPSPLTVLRSSPGSLPGSPITVMRETSAVSLPGSPAVSRRETVVQQSSASSAGGFSSYRTYETSMVSSSSGSHQMPSHIPVLEDKYNVNENLEELGSASKNGNFNRSRTQQNSVVTFSTTGSSQHKPPVRNQTRDHKQTSKVQSQSYCYVVSSSSSSSSSRQGGPEVRNVVRAYVGPSIEEVSSPRILSPQVTSGHSWSQPGNGARAYAGPSIEEVSSPKVMSPPAAAAGNINWAQQDLEASSINPYPEQHQDPEELAFEELVREEQEREEIGRKQKEVTFQNGHHESHSPEPQHQQQQQRQPVLSLKEPEVETSYHPRQPVQLPRDADDDDEMSGPLHLRQPTQSPKVPEEERPKYRTPPSTPFQPAFYKTPESDPDRVKNPEFKLPSQKRTKTSADRWTASPPQKQLDDDGGEAEF